jgi:hypothetical protein
MKNLMKNLTKIDEKRKNKGNEKKEAQTLKKVESQELLRQIE